MPRAWLKVGLTGLMMDMLSLRGKKKREGPGGLINVNYRLKAKGLSTYPGLYVFQDFVVSLSTGL